MGYLIKPIDIVGKPAFQSFLTSLESLADELIESVVSTVPDEWDLNHNEAKALIEFLKRRKKLVRRIIESSFA